jgi:hypothetical protein
LDPSIWAVHDHDRQGRMASVAVRTGTHEVTGREGSQERSQQVNARGGDAVEVHLAPAVSALTQGEAGPIVPKVASNPDEPHPGRAKWITVVALGSGAVLTAGAGVALAVLARRQAGDVQSTVGEHQEAWKTEQPEREAMAGWDRAGAGQFSGGFFLSRRDLPRAVAST